MTIDQKLICLLLPVFLPLAASGQEVNRSTKQIETQRRQTPLPKSDTTSVELDKEFQEWLLNEPLKLDTPTYRFQYHFRPSITVPNPLDLIPPKPTYRLDPNITKIGSGTQSIIRNVDLLMSSTNHNIPGLALVRAANFDIRYRTGAFTLKGGTSLAKIQNFGWHRDQISFHLNAEYRLSERVLVGLQGTYAPRVKNLGPVAPFATTTSYGAYVKIRINSWLALGPGITPYYDPVTRKWTVGFFLLPEIDLSALLHLKSYKKARQKARLKQILDNY